MFSVNEAEAQNKGLEDAKEAKNLVDETNKYEEQQRAELQKQIKERQKKTIESLKKLAEKYRDKGERRKAREILKAIRKLEDKLDGLEFETEPVPESEVFEYGQIYLFKSGKIQGRITFMANGKANAIFKLGDDSQNVIWDFEEKDDHVYIKDAGDLGKIYVSEIPKSDKRSIMIRWGGKLRHEVLTASY